MRAEGIFIAVEVEDSVASDPEMAAKLAEVCPVDIFAVNEAGTLELVDKNVDECVLCRLCLDVAPGGAVRIIKRYDNDAEL